MKKYAYNDITLMQYIFLIHGTQVGVGILLSERLFPFDMRKESDKLDRLIEEQMNVQFKQLIEKFQKHQIDPIGLGLYARAFQFKSYEKVEDDWGKAFAEAKVNVTTKITLKSMGVVK